MLNAVGEEVGREGLLVENTEPFTVAFTNDDTPKVVTDGNILNSGVDIADNFPNTVAPALLPTGFSDTWRFQAGAGAPAFNEFGLVSADTIRIGDFAQGTTSVVPQITAALAQPNAAVVVTEVGSTQILAQAAVISITNAGTSEQLLIMDGTFDESQLTDQTLYTLHFGTPGQGAIDDETNILNWTHPDFVVTGGTAVTQVRMFITDDSPIPVARIYIAANSN